MEERYINPFTDFGFKRLFGTEMNKDLLISFLNSLFHGHEDIVDISYRNTEQLGSLVQDRKAVFDVYCENTKGEKFIVEMQKAEQNYFKDRSIFYATFPIREQAKRGEWDFQLKGVYTVGILNFIFPGDEYDKDYFHHEVKLIDVEDKHGDPTARLSISPSPFYDKLTYVYLEMPKFNKTEDELVSMYDKWLFVLKNLSRLFERPAALQERVFTRLFEQAEIARFTPDESRIYEESLKQYRDMHNTIASAERRGRDEANRENARKMKVKGYAIEDIAEITGLTAEEIAQL